MAEGMIEARVDPVCFFIRLLFSHFIPDRQGLSQRELHVLHHEVKALQSTLGISYKDAAHRLFMGEVERVKKADSSTKLFGAVRERIDDVVNREIWPPIRSLDKGEMDEYVVENGKWKAKDGGDSHK